MTNGTSGTRERPMKTISTLDASLKTMAVTITTLTVSNRQVTQALFRQLKEEPLIDPETRQFRGLPWGTVNYCPSKDCADRGEHLHAVFQKGNELRRATVARNGFSRLTEYRQLTKERSYLTELCAQWSSLQFEPCCKGEAISQIASFERGCDYPFTFAVDGWGEVCAESWRGDAVQEVWRHRHADRHPGIAGYKDALKCLADAQCEVDWEWDPEGNAARYQITPNVCVPDDLKSLTNKQLKELKVAQDQKQRLEVAATSAQTRLQERQNALQSALGYDPETLGNGMSRLSAVCNAVADCEREWEKRYQELLALDQLFIAV